jgi:hypothetical protein
MTNMIQKGVETSIVRVLIFAILSSICIEFFLDIERIIVLK